MYYTRKSILYCENIVWRCKFVKISRQKIDLAVARAGVPSYCALAQRIGCSAKGLSAVLNRGSCKPATAAKIAAALGVPLEELLEEGGDCR